MLAGKVERFANMATKRRVVVMLCCLLLMFSLTGFTFSAPANLEPEIAILGPNVQTYDLDALQWEFPFTVVGFGPGTRTVRLAEFSIDGHDLLRNIPMAQRTMTVHRLDDEIGRETFRNWNNYRQRASVLRVRNDERISLSTTEARDFREGNARMRGVMRRRGEIAPVVLPINVSELPFRVAADGHYRVRAVVERGGMSTTWEGEVLIVDVEPLATNPVWTPADLHLHSAFALDGRFTPRELAPMLANRGYAIGYITDEPAGQYITTRPILPRMSGMGRPGMWAPEYGIEADPGTNAWLTSTFGNDRVRYLPYLPTWEAYSAAVIAASTAQVAMFPGAEIAASTTNFMHTGHNGHALAYGIQNLIGVGVAGVEPSFDTTGLRYNWFVPSTLLPHINNNRTGRSSASIAHPVNLQIPFIPAYPWNVWGAALPRYHGFELMYAGQTNFCPDNAIANRWRQEIVANLTRAFAGNGFPSARTGSDWGGAFSQLWDISYFTFIGLPNPPPSDMRFLAQNDVDAALRAGRTVASRLGGIAALRLRNTQGALHEIGSWFTMPAGATVSGDIVLRAARSGSYKVRIIQNFAGHTGHIDGSAVPAFQGLNESTRHLSGVEATTYQYVLPFRR
ncbi:MAG: hypothetical protein KGZ50_02875 [Peptococcaceae bacterium]|nr:hypothetical protein [Peptococcaceae bacterium]